MVVSAKTTSDAAAIPASEFPRKSWNVSIFELVRSLTKKANPNTQLSTINTVAREITEAGNSALAIPVNTRDHDSIDKLVKETIAKLGSIDVLIYNSGGQYSIDRTISNPEKFTARYLT